MRWLSWLRHIQAGGRVIGAAGKSNDAICNADAMRHACDAGRLAYLAGCIPKRLYATASSPEKGVIGAKPR
jgi:thiazole synthase